jgi:predicted AAA+ superfamily ATPase
MIKRQLEPKLLSYISKYRAIALIGPRQSGKTTLARKVFSNFEYISLENPEHRARLLEDPKLFLISIKNNCILDEVQNTPVIFSYLQEILDNPNDKRIFILTGSNSFALNQKLSQSLAGRIRILTVLPFSLSEIKNYPQTENIDQLIWTGSYPAIYDRSLDPREWYADYYNTYIQKDVRSTLNISDLLQFDKFIRICAGRSGQLLNYLNMGNEVGISQPTAIRWSSVLESSYLTFRLAPHFKNFNKRIIKSPKLYFYDTGLLCFLLRIQNYEQLITHPLRGQIFENWVILEFLKMKYLSGTEPNLYFWRDQHGHEIDLLEDMGDILMPIEIKSGSTFSSDWLNNLEWFNNLQKQKESILIYGGLDNFLIRDTQVRSWQNLL